MKQLAPESYLCNISNFIGCDLLIQNFLMNTAPAQNKCTYKMMTSDGTLSGICSYIFVVLEIDAKE